MGDYYTANGVIHPFIAGPNRVGMVDLNSISSLYLRHDRLLTAVGINDLGQIIANSNENAYLLTPGGVALAPEPATLVLLGLGLLGLGFSRRKRT